MAPKRYHPTAANLEKYNLSEEEFEEMYDRQAGRCFICESNPIQAIDHCHRSGHVRGLLCRRCNMGLGYFRDQPDRLRQAIQYLHTFESRLEGDEDDEDVDPIPRQPENWYRGSPYPTFGYSHEFGEADTGEPYLTVSRNGEAVLEVLIGVPLHPRAKAEVWIRRKTLAEFPIVDTGTFN